MPPPSVPMRWLRPSALALVVAALSSCATTNPAALLAHVEPAEREGYGYTPEDPVRIGFADPQGSIALSRAFLAGLRKDGEPLAIVGRSSVGPPPLTDAYTLVTETGRDTLVLYLNVYRRAPLHVPRGLTYVAPPAR